MTQLKQILLLLVWLLGTTGVIAQPPHSSTGYYLDFMPEHNIVEVSNGCTLQLSEETSFVISNNDGDGWGGFGAFLDVPFIGEERTFGVGGIGFYITQDGYYVFTLTNKGEGNWFVSILRSLVKHGNIAAIPDQTFTGSAIEPEITVTDGEKTLTLGTDYTVSYSDNTNVGTAKATITGKGNYSGTVEETFTINAKALTAANVFDIPAQTYTNSAIEPEIVCDGITLVKGTDYDVLYSDNINVGTAKATITGIGNYSGTVEKTFTIAKDLTAANVSDIAAQTYTGSAITPTVTVKDGSKTLALNTDYTVSYSNNTNAGTAKATITGKGNYSGTVEKTFTINAKSLAASNISDIAAQTYTGSAITPTVTVKDGSKMLTLNTDYSVSYSNNTNAGTATIKITGKGNYNGTVGKTFTINAKALAASTISAIAAQTYTGSAIEPEITVTDGEKTLVLGTDYEVSYSDNTNVGTATVTITGINNYSGTVEKAFEIKSENNQGGENQGEENQSEENQSEENQSENNQGGENPSTPVSEITPNSGVKVWSYNHTIYIENAADTKYKIIDLQGRTITTSTAKSDREEVVVPNRNNSIAIVIINGKSFKLKI